MTRKAYALEGTRSLDKALNTNAQMSAAKVVEEFEYVDRKCEFRVDWSPSDEANVHKCDIGILILALPHGCGGKPTTS